MAFPTPPPGSGTASEAVPTPQVGMDKSTAVNQPIHFTWTSSWAGRTKLTHHRERSTLSLNRHLIIYFSVRQFYGFFPVAPPLLEKAANSNFRSELLISQISCPRHLSGVESHPESNALDFIQIGVQLAELLLFLTFVVFLSLVGYYVATNKGILAPAGDRTLTTGVDSGSGSGVALTYEAGALLDRLDRVCGGLGPNLVFRRGLRGHFHLIEEIHSELNNSLRLCNLNHIDYRIMRRKSNFTSFHLIFIFNAARERRCSQKAANLNLELFKGNHSFINDYHG